MVVPNDNLLCKQAKNFYYNYVMDDGKEEIPVDMIEHMGLCPYCKSGMDKLKAQLTEIDDNVDAVSERDEVIFENLELHYNYINKPVSCNVVKLFLPSLADPALAVRVPTPITAHIDNCPQCGESLKAIYDLGLTHKQLCILGQVYAQKIEPDHEMCSKALACLDAVSTMGFGGIEVEVLRHFCICPDCRRILLNRRCEFINDIGWNEEGAHIPCEEVKATDLFDYVIPYGIDPANDQYAMFRHALTSHLANCKECLAKMNELHNQIYSILECEETNVVTIFKADESIQEEDGLPIAVEVLDKDKMPSRSESVDQPLRFKPVFTKMAAVAAILLVVLFSFRGSVLQAVDLGQIYKALAKVKNVHIVRYDSETSESIYETWTSQLLNIKMSKTSTESVLWDINSKELKTNKVAIGSIEIKEIFKEDVDEVETTMHAPWNLLPFTSVADIPRDVIWQQVKDESVSGSQSIDVYDLILSKKAMDGVLVYHKWRLFVSTKTHLPHRIEFLKKYTKEDKYRLATTLAVDYPTVSQIQQVIEQAGF